MKMLAAVALGGAVGAVGRYLVFIATGALAGTLLPVGTLTVNIVGSFIMGLIVPLIGAGMILSPELRAMITVGGLGAFTTFSTFSMDTVYLMQRGDVAFALLYILLSVALSIAAFAGGYYLMRYVIA